MGVSRRDPSLPHHMRGDIRKRPPRCSIPGHPKPDLKPRPRPVKPEKVCRHIPYELQLNCMGAVCELERLKGG